MNDKIKIIHLSECKVCLACLEDITREPSETGYEYGFCSDDCERRLCDPKVTDCCWASERFSILQGKSNINNSVKFKYKGKRYFIFVRRDSPRRDYCYMSRLACPELRVGFGWYRVDDYYNYLVEQLKVSHMRLQPCEQSLADALKYVSKYNQQSEKTVSSLQEQVSSLRGEVAELKAMFTDFMNMFSEKAQ